MAGKLKSCEAANDAVFTVAALMGCVVEYIPGERYEWRVRKSISGICIILFGCLCYYKKYKTSMRCW